MIQLIVSDMDGTLVSGHVKITDFTAKMVKKAQEDGIRFLCATGRNLQEAQKPLKDAEIECEIIGVNGAIVYDKQGKILSTNPISTETSLKLVELFRQHELYAELGTVNGVFSESQTKRLEFFTRHMAESTPPRSFKESLILASTAMSYFHITYVEDLETVIQSDSEEVVKFFLMAENGEEQLLPLKKEIEESFDDLVVTSSGQHNIEINHIDAQKGFAVKRIAEEMGIDKESVMAIGDSFNDISMLDYAGASFAMGQAKEEIKQHAKYVTESNQNDGVAHAIERVLNGELEED
ncbi:MAG: Cof-type HAD-IIB family hydrolase [Streptococcaceae bacterium]|jgi:Cof subfamily protein (haloacid dehalogenase superfamily)|nr:Cof-type HAD-IIB family hydrolase [Streptococcaceae bacterium]